MKNIDLIKGSSNFSVNFKNILAKKHLSHVVKKKNINNYNRNFNINTNNRMVTIGEHIYVLKTETVDLSNWHFKTFLEKYDMNFNMVGTELLLQEMNYSSDGIEENYFQEIFREDNNIYYMNYSLDYNNNEGLINILKIDSDMNVTTIKNFNTKFILVDGSFTMDSNNFYMSISSYGGELTGGKVRIYKIPRDSNVDNTGVTFTDIEVDNYGGIRKNNIISDGDYLYLYDYGLHKTLRLFRANIYKLDISDLSEVWKKELMDFLPKNLKYNLTENSFIKNIVLFNNNLIVSYNYTNNTFNGYGNVLCLDSDGNKLWHKYFKDKQITDMYINNDTLECILKKTPYINLGEYNNNYISKSYMDSDSLELLKIKSNGNMQQIYLFNVSHKHNIINYVVNGDNKIMLVHDHLILFKELDNFMDYPADILKHKNV